MIRTPIAARFAASLIQKEWGLSDDYEIMSMLGKGSSARVFMGANVISGQRVVIKVFKQLPVESIKRQISVNLRLLSKFKQNGKHAEFIPLLDTCYDYTSSTFTLIYKYFPGVPLNQLIETMTLADSLRHSLILAHTLKYIHSLDIIHRDLKPANVLITPEGPKLFDFGLAKEMQRGTELQINNFGTKCYKCPEVIYRMNKYDKSVDVWGLGLIMAELSLNKRHLLPFQNDASMLSQLASLCGFQEKDSNLFSSQLKEHIQTDKSKSWEVLAMKKQLQPSLIGLIKNMLQINPAKRPNLDQVIAHSIFKSVKL